MRKIRVLIAKPGLDGHDRGAKVVAYLLREAGMEVIYTGLHKTVDQIVEAAIQEDVDAIGLSILSGAHVPITEKLMARLRERKADDIAVTVGGVIPRHDVEKLKSLGAKAVFPGGTSFADILRFFQEELPKLRSGAAYPGLSEGN
ncbi:MAG: cobalamin B12-binding domain-containing protein [Desulfotomaculales bacterium]